MKLPRELIVSKNSFRAVRLKIFKIGPERRFRLRLRTRSWVRDVRGWRLPCRSRPSSTRWDTLFWRQEKSYQLHGLTITFQVACLLAALSVSPRSSVLASLSSTWSDVRQPPLEEPKNLTVLIIRITTINKCCFSFLGHRTYISMHKWFSDLSIFIVIIIFSTESLCFINHD